MVQRLALLLLVFAFLPAASGQARYIEGRHAGVARGGIELTLIVPPGVYAHDALIQVQIRVQNVIRRPLFISNTCPLENPRTEVMDDSGVRLFPPAVGPVVPAACPPGAMRRYAPGQEVTTPMYTIARGSWIRAAVTVHVAGRRPFTARTPLIHLQLGTGPSPTVTLCSSPQICADVSPPVGESVQGPLVYAGSVRCPGMNRRAERRVQQWRLVEIQGRRVYPGCPRPSRWNAVVGWPNYPVATFVWSRGGRS
ncbi:MAG: hypothetical protein ACR2JC_18675 [Chloroflexota bacterium]